jgi:hypothetical protein
MVWHNDSKNLKGVEQLPRIGGHMLTLQPRVNTEACVRDLDVYDSVALCANSKQTLTARHEQRQSITHGM